MRYGCIGEHLGHSFSVEIHALLTDETYGLCELSREQLPAFLGAKDFFAINVTIPYKTDVLPYLDGISDTARGIGAVNTILNRGGKLYGENTDFFGMRELIRRIGVSIEGKKVAVLGSGGTSRTARAVLASLGAGEIMTVSRTKSENTVTYEELYTRHADVKYLVNTTPAGMFPNLSASPVDLDRLPSVTGVADAVYNPLRTRLILDAKARGIPAEGGLYMLVAQGVRASELFFDRVYPAETIETVYRKILRKKENPVLIGMPGCGKTTVGKLLAERLARPFVDLDAEIERKTGKSVPEIFAADGEAGFRNIETDVLSAVSARSGIVLACGGGTVLRAENLQMLRQNGKLIWLDRPVSNLLPTADRPLSRTTDALESLWRQREPIYRSAADLRVDARKSPEEIAALLGKEPEE